MDTHTVMLILLIVLLAFRGWQHLSVKFGTIEAAKNPNSNPTNSSISETTPISSPASSRTETDILFWRGYYGTDEDWI